MGEADPGLIHSPQLTDQKSKANHCIAHGPLCSTPPGILPGHFRPFDVIFKGFSKGIRPLLASLCPHPSYPLPLCPAGSGHKPCDQASLEALNPGRWVSLRPVNNNQEPVGGLRRYYHVKVLGTQKGDRMNHGKEEPMRRRRLRMIFIIVVQS